MRLEEAIADVALVGLLISAFLSILFGVRRARVHKVENVNEFKQESLRFFDSMSMTGFLLLILLILAIRSTRNCEQNDDLAPIFGSRRP